MVFSKRRRCQVCLAAFFITLFLTAPLAVQPSSAATVSPKITVKSVVLPQLHLKTIYQLPEITITEGDIKKGFTDAPSASILEVTNNNPAGYLLAFEGSLGPFKEIHIKGLPNPVQLDSGNAFIQQPFTSKNKETIELSYRGILAGNTKPGIYSWPFSIAVHPLEYLDYHRKKK